MQFLLLIYSNEADQANMPPEEQQKYIGAYQTFTQDIAQKGHLVAGDALQSITTATSVRVRNGETITSDGPFAETKEQLGGYYLVEADDLDKAIELAARIPTATHGTIEVRPIMVYDF